MIIVLSQLKNKMKFITYINSNNITREKQYDDNVVSINLSDKNIIEITGLDTLVNLQTLDLSNNMITEIKGLDSLVSLQSLSLHNNMITEIKGLDTLVNFHFLYLYENKRFG